MLCSLFGRGLRLNSVLLEYSLLHGRVCRIRVRSWVVEPLCGCPDQQFRDCGPMRKFKSSVLYIVCFSESVVPPPNPTYSKTAKLFFLVIWTLFRVGSWCWPPTNSNKNVKVPIVTNIYVAGGHSAKVCSVELPVVLFIYCISKSQVFTPRDT